MDTNRRGAAVRDPTFGSIIRSTLDLLPLRSGQKTLVLEDRLRQGYASKRQSYESNVVVVIAAMTRLRNVRLTG
jgi:hypothetical protein